MRFNQNNLRKRKRKSIEFEGIQFNDKEEWINREIKWSPKDYYEYDYIDNFIWNENGEGQIISFDYIEHVNINNQELIKITFFISSSLYSPLLPIIYYFYTDAFTIESQEKLKNYFNNLKKKKLSANEDKKVSFDSNEMKIEN
tara:strand:+ start:1103 stop:1531 length:429 start_codon:yes stop_codon:yes gene_type:complete